MGSKLKQAKKVKHYPLSWGIMFIIFICWLVPLVLFSIFMWKVSWKNTYSYVTEVLEESVSNNVDFVQYGLSSLAEASPGASHIDMLKNAYFDYIDTEKEGVFYTTVEDFLTAEYAQNQMINAVYMLFPEIDKTIDSNYYVYNNSLTTNDSVKKFYKSEVLPAALDVSQSLEDEIDFIYNGENLYMVRAVRLGREPVVSRAVIVVDINMQQMVSGLLSNSYFSDVSLYVNDIDLRLCGDGVYQRPQLKTGETYSKMLENDQLVLEGNVHSDRYSLLYYVNADVGPMLSSTSDFSNTIIILLILCVPPLVGTILFFFSRKVARPVRKLASFATEIEQGDFGAQIKTTSLGSRELVLLGEKMNKMSAKLKEQFEHLYREELALRDAEFKALQSQINPHFLGNTLETINWEARLAGNENVSNMLEALGTMMSASLNRENRALVTLEQEMVYIDAYLYIIKARLGDRLDVVVDIEEDLKQWKVPRLILQPLVENAVDHGIDASGGGQITIRVSKTTHDWMHLEVINTGDMSEDEEKKVKELLQDSQLSDRHMNVGIRNINQRLKILYSDRANFTIKNDDRGNTVASMNMHKM